MRNNALMLLKKVTTHATCARYNALTNERTGPVMDYCHAELSCTLPKVHLNLLFKLLQFFKWVDDLLLFYYL